MLPRPGLWSRPPDDAAWAKNRLGQVGPGIDENQLSQTTNSPASASRTGSVLAVSKHFITSPGSAPLALCLAISLAKLATKPVLVGVGYAKFALACGARSGPRSCSYTSGKSCAGPTGMHRGASLLAA